MLFTTAVTVLIPLTTNRGLLALIMYASLQNKTSQLYTPSIIVVLSLICCTY